MFYDISDHFGVDLGQVNKYQEMITFLNPDMQDFMKDQDILKLFIENH